MNPGQHLFDLRADIFRVVHRRALRRLDDHNDVALIVLGNKSTRNFLVDPVSNTEKREEHEHCGETPADDAPDGFAVGVGAGCDDAIEGSKDTALRAFPVMTEQNCGKRGGKSERVESRNGYGKRDGQRELAEKDSSGAGEQCDGHEDGHKNQGGRDYGAGYFSHGYGSGVVGLSYALGDVALHVFDDHDGIIHDQAGSESDAEQSESIDGETEELHENKCADKRDGDGDSGNEGAAPILKKYENDEDHQQDGLEQGDEHVSNGFADNRGGVESDGGLQARWE